MSYKTTLKTVVILFCGGFLFFGLAGKAEAAAYLEYNTAKTDGGTTGIVNVYQPIQNAPSTATYSNKKWVQHKIYQYPGGAGSWDNSGNVIGNIATVSAYNSATSSSDWTWNNGTGGATWANNTPVAGYSFKRFIAPTPGYTDYSASGQITLSQDADSLLLGYWYNPTVNGVLRVKINGVVQSNVGNLDSNGEFDTSATTNANLESSGNVYSITIGANVKAGDVVTVEVKTYNGTKSRIYIYGIKYANYASAVPGSANWQFVDQYRYESDFITTTIAASLAPVGDSGSFNNFCTGPAHPNHENAGSITSISIDSTPYTLGTNLNVGNVVSGDSITIIEANNVYGTASPADDFADITRTFVWTTSNLTRTWNLTFKKQGANATFFYIAMDTPSTDTTDSRYWSISSTTNILMPSDRNKSGVDLMTPLENSNYLSIGGGDVGVRVAISSQNTAYGYQSGASSNKIYLRKMSWEKLWNASESVSNTVTITYSHELPQSIDWRGKTLIVAKNDTISGAASALPFQGAGNYVKFYTNTGLTFSGLAPTRTLFTSLKDSSIGDTVWELSGAPAKGNWSGLTVTGAVNATENVINYSTTGLTLSSNANAYNNTLYNNTTGINAASGSVVKNNILNSNTANTTGAGTFDYDLYIGNIENHGIAGDPLFTNAAGADFSLQSASPAIDSGTSTGITSTDYLSDPIYGTPDIGAYEYQPPHDIAPVTPDTIDVGAGARIYGDGKFRDLGTTNSNAAHLKITPSGGSFDVFGSTARRPAWLDVTNITNWSNTHKTWTESNASSSSMVTDHTVGDLNANKSYTITITGALASNITGINGTTCSNGVCQSNGSGNLSFRYNGGYSNHTFDIFENPPAPTLGMATTSTIPLVINTNGNPGSVTYAVYDAINSHYFTSSGAITSIPTFFASSTWSGAARGLSASSYYTFQLIARSGDGLSFATSTGATAATAGAAVNLSKTIVYTNEGIAADTYDIVLNSQPTSTVQITISPDSLSTVSPSTINFTPANWNTPVTITVTAIVKNQGGHLSTITHTASSLAAGYRNVTIASVTNSITARTIVPGGGGGGGGGLAPVTTQYQSETNDPNRAAYLNNLALMNLPVNSLVKLQDDGNGTTQEDSAVYYIGSDGKRHAFPNSKIYFTWYKDFSDVRIISLDQLASIPLGTNVRYKPGSRMVKFTTDPKVYAIDVNGILRWVKTEAVAKALYGDNWNTFIDDLSDAFFGNYKFGQDINSSSEFDLESIKLSQPTISANLML